ncbi:MAG: hypothetical protein L6Q76_26165, partial [Polyangiaceae bacterium]|nr:hypothetical protein [Polyangiaceae bacterium]
MRRWRASVAGLLGFLFSAGSCNQIGGIHEGVPRGDDPVVPCLAVEDCVKAEAPECRIPVACEQGLCRYGDAIEGTSAKTQVPGDCTEVVCDGAGKTKLLPRDTDTQDDGNVCTLDACNGTTPTHTLQASVACFTGPAGTKGKGICLEGIQQCDAQGNAIGGCEGEVLPKAENCFSPLDEDCDGKANEDGDGCQCVPGELMPCYTGPDGTQGVGNCHVGMKSCNADGLTYGICVGEQKPETEICDASGTDEDCDGKVNEEGADCMCGDGYVQPGLGETCDDGGTSDGDPCSPTCKEQKVLQVVAGDEHTCALLNDGNLKCWGGNGVGQLGLGDTSQRGDSPNEMGDNLPAVNLGTSTTASAITARGDHTCAVLNDGSVKCCGYNDFGQLGLGDTIDRGDGPNEMGDTLPT